MENLSAFFTRVEPDEMKRVALFKRLVERMYFVMACDTTDEIKIRLQDAGGEWVSYSDEPPENPLNLIVIRQSDGTATDSPYNFLVEVWQHCRKVLLGLSPPDWTGVLRHAYIPDNGADTDEWKSAVDAPLMRSDKLTSGPKWEMSGTIEFKARQIGVQWMNEQSTKPGVNEIAKHVEKELKRLDIRGVRDDYWNWQTIKKEALTGITGRQPKGKK